MEDADFARELFPDLSTDSLHFNDLESVCFEALVFVRDLTDLPLSFYAAATATFETLREHAVRLAYSHLLASAPSKAPPTLSELLLHTRARFFCGEVEYASSDHLVLAVPTGDAKPFRCVLSDPFDVSPSPGQDSDGAWSPMHSDASLPRYAAPAQPALAARRHSGPPALRTSARHAGAAHGREREGGECSLTGNNLVFASASIFVELLSGHSFGTIVRGRWTPKLRLQVVVTPPEAREPGRESGSDCDPHVPHEPPPNPLAGAPPGKEALSSWDLFLLAPQVTVIVGSEACLAKLKEWDFSPADLLKTSEYDVRVKVKEEGDGVWGVEIDVRVRASSKKKKYLTLIRVEGWAGGGGVASSPYYVLHSTKTTPKEEREAQPRVKRQKNI